MPPAVGVVGCEQQGSVQPGEYREDEERQGHEPERNTGDPHQH
jgi:hypothetical protein